MKYKVCSKCKIKLPVNQFNKDQNQKDGFTCRCKKCRKTSINKNKAKRRQRRYYLINREYLLAQNKHYMKKDKKRQAEYSCIRRANERAKKAGNTDKLSIRDWRKLKDDYNYTCLCCYKQEPEITLTLDHVIPLSLGGKNTISNIQPLCGEYNGKKHCKSTDYRQNVKLNFSML